MPNRPVPDYVEPGIEFGWWRTGDSVYPSPSKSHQGKDWKAVKTPVWFRESGVIVFSGLLGELGLYVQIRSDRDPSLWWGLAHLSRCDVQVGQHVADGEAVGITGGVPGEYGAGLSSGLHLHEECRIGWQWGTRIDPDLVVLEETMDKQMLTEALNEVWDVREALRQAAILLPQLEPWQQKLFDAVVKGKVAGDIQ